MKDWLTDRAWITRQSWPRNGLSYWSAGAQTRHPQMIVLHSTETTGFPGYNGGAAAPHFTIDLVSGAVRQHIPLSRGARALTLGGTRLANVAGVVQIEIIGAVTPGYPAKYGHYDLVNRFPKDEKAQRHLARLLAAIHEETGIPLQSSVRWVKYPASYGTRASQRLSVDAYLNYRGVLGHQHVPGNDHGDPGALPVNAVLSLARSLAKGGGSGSVSKPSPAPAPAPVQGASVKDVQRALVALGYDVGATGVDGKWGPATEKAVRAYQKDRGLAVDGIVGPKTLKALEDDMSMFEQKPSLSGKAAEKFGPGGHTRDALLGYAALGGLQATSALPALRGAVDGLTAAVTRLAAAQGADPEEIRKVVEEATEAGVRKALEGADVTISLG